MFGVAGSQSVGRSLGDRCFGASGFDSFVLRFSSAGGELEFVRLPLPLLSCSDGVALGASLRLLIVESSVLFFAFASFLAGKKVVMLPSRWDGMTMVRDVFFGILGVSKRGIKGWKVLRDDDAGCDEVAHNDARCTFQARQSSRWVS